jgi:hypothetical protein
LYSSVNRYVAVGRDLLGQRLGVLSRVLAGRKVVQLPQVPSELLLLLDEVYLHALFRQFERRHHPGGPASDDERRLVHVDCEVL